MITLKCDPSKLTVPRVYGKTKYAPYVERHKKFEIRETITKEERKRRIKEAHRSNMFWTPERDAYIIKLRKQGWSIDKIAAEIGKKPTAVQARFKNMGKKRDWKKVGKNRDCNHNHYTEAQDEVIREMRAADKPYKEIASELGRSVSSVTKRAKRIGVS